MFNLLSSSSSNQKLFVSRSMHICIFLYMYCRLLFYSFILFISFIFCVNLVSIVRFFLNQNITYTHTQIIMQNYEEYILHSVRWCIPNDCDSRISRWLHQIVNNTDVIRFFPSTIQKYSTKNWCIFDQLQSCFELRSCLFTQNHCQKYTGHILKFFHTWYC